MLTGELIQEWIAYHVHYNSNPSAFNSVSKSPNLPYLSLTCSVSIVLPYRMRPTWLFSSIGRLARLTVAIPP